MQNHCHYNGKYRGTAHSICKLKYIIPKEVNVVFHNGSNYDYHFIIKELAKAFNGEFNCVGENTEKYKNFLAPTTNEVKKIDKYGGKYKNHVLQITIY